MKRKNLLLVAVIAIAAINMSNIRKQDSQTATSQAKDSLEEDRAKHVKALKELIKGKENLPADSVFKNIKALKGVPAGRLLAIMNMGYSRSLGVSCGHCHNTTKWESEEKIQKQIAREMMALAAKTNASLKEIKGIKSQTPIVNCTTCHRGALKPALDLK